MREHDGNDGITPPLSSSVESFLPVNGIGFLPLQRSRVETDTDKADNVTLSKRVVPRVFSRNIVSFAGGSSLGKRAFSFFEHKEMQNAK